MEKSKMSRVGLIQLCRVMYAVGWLSDCRHSHIEMNRIECGWYETTCLETPDDDDDNDETTHDKSISSSLKIRVQSCSIGKWSRKKLILL